MNWEFNKGWLATETAGSSQCLKNNIKPIDLMKGLQAAATSPLLLLACPVFLCQPQSSNYEWERVFIELCCLPACLPATPSKLEKQRERERERGVCVAQTIDFVRSQALLIIQRLIMMMLLVFPVPKMISDTHLCSTLVNKLVLVN